MSLWSCNECSGVHDQWGKAVVRIDWRRALALLEAGQGEDVNEIRHGRTILYQAVLDREVAAIEALLRHGADSTLGRPVQEHHITQEVLAADTPLMLAALRCDVESDKCIAALVRGGADINYCTPADGPFRPSNALQRAVSGSNCLRTTKLLLELGANPNLCGNYALNCAVEHPEPEVVAILLKAGADVNAVRYLDGRTPLDTAQRVVCSEESWTSTSEVDCVRRRVVGTLLRAGATIDPWHAADPTRSDLAMIDIEHDEWDAPVRIGYARELPMYLRAVLAAGSFARYDVARRAPFVAMLERSAGFPLPRDMISVVCAFWLRVGEYHPETNALIDFCE